MLHEKRRRAAKKVSGQSKQKKQTKQTLTQKPPAVAIIFTKDPDIGNFSLPGCGVGIVLRTVLDKSHLSSALSKHRDFVQKSQKQWVTQADR